MIRFLKSGLVLLLAIMLSIKVQAQSGLIKEANRQFDMMSYINAIELYEKAFKKADKLSDNDRQSAKIRLANAYRLIKDTQNAERVYREIVSSASGLSGDATKTYLYFAQVLASNGKYRESQEAYQKYMSVQTDDNRKEFTSLQTSAEKLQKNASSYKIEYLNMNSGKADFSPVYYKNGMVFCSNRGEGSGIAKRIFCWDNSAFLDLYYLNDMSLIGGQSAASLGGSNSGASRKVKGPGRNLGNDEYTSPTANDSRTVGTYGSIAVNNGLGYEETPLSPSERFSKTLNSKYHEGPSCFTHDGSKVIFTRNNFNNGKYKTSSDGINKLKIYTADDKNGGWANVKEVPFNSDEYSNGHPTITKDDKLVYFVSDMPGGFGGTDIYVVSYNNGEWGTPVNLGKTVNTSGNEMFPYVDDNNNLYLASDGHAGLGDLDIFWVEMKNGTPIGKVRNLGAPINSSKDDFGLITDAERKSGYFSSNRKRGGADDDIYRFTREGALWPCRDLIASVYDADTKAPLEGVAVTVSSADKIVDSKTTDNDGNANLCLEEDTEYNFNASKSGYTANIVKFATKADAGDKVEIPLTKIKADTLAAGSGNSNSTTGTETGVTGDPNAAFGNSKENTKVTGPVLKGVLKRQKDGTPIEGATVTLKNLRDGTSKTVVTGPDGRYEFPVEEGVDYELEASKDGWGTRGRKIKRIKAGQMPDHLIADLNMFESGDVIRLDNIYYDYNSALIRQDASVELGKLIELMRKYPHMTVEFRSHTDCRGETDYNQRLSDRRARCAVAYMKKHGIRASRFVIKGYGESELISGCADCATCTEEQYQQDRRTEIKILKMK
jgi:outer membrane protein OmpA-like peptidoglycan-associated protein